MTRYTKDFENAVRIGRPPNITSLFPNSHALLVSGKYIDNAMIKKGRCMTIAANARSHMIIRGVLLAAQKANAAIIIEIARSEGGADPYCPVSLWNMARQVDAIANELHITIPIAIHADHYGLKKESDLAGARKEIPSLFEAGITSIAIDASHMPDDLNLLSNLAVSDLIPKWAGLETEVGEIKGNQGLSTPEEALFLIRGLNAHNIFPNWIALNNGTTHGIESNTDGIQIELTAAIHKALAPYHISGAQHGTSGNDAEKLRRIAEETATTKANVATALQMIGWGIDVDEFGNAVMDAGGDVQKITGEGLDDDLWAEMKLYADAREIKGSNLKKLNLPFENKILGQPRAIRERMVAAISNFTYGLLTDVFNAGNSADLVIAEILEKQSYDPGPKAERIEDPLEWTEEKIRERAKSISSNKGPEGDFDE